MTRITTGPRAAVHARAKRPERDSSNTLGPSRIGRRNRNLDHNSQTSPGEPSVVAATRGTALYCGKFEDVDLLEFDQLYCITDNSST